MPHLPRQAKPRLQQRHPLLPVQGRKLQQPPGLPKERRQPMSRNYDLDWDDYSAIDAWGEGTADTYAVDFNGLWYKTE